MILLATISALGFGTLLIGELPRQPGKASALVATALAVVGFAALVLGFGFAFIAPTISAHLSPLGEHVWTVVLFALGVALTTITLVLDQAVIGILRGGLQFWRNALLGVSKLAALWAVAAFTEWQSGIVIYATWTAGTLISVAFLALMFFIGGSRPRQWRPEWQLMRSLRKMALWHHGVDLGLQAPLYLLPVLATALISPTDGAYFYTAWLIATVDVCSAAIAEHCLVRDDRCAACGTKIQNAPRLSSSISVATGIIGIIVIFVAGPSGARLLRCRITNHKLASVCAFLFLRCCRFPREVPLRRDLAAVLGMYCAAQR